MQIPLLFKPQTEWLPPTELKDLSDAKEIAIDLETCDPSLTILGSGAITGKGFVVGIAVAVDGWSGYYPIAHEGGGNLDKRIVLDWFQDILNTNANKIFHNAMYDVTWIKAMGLNINGRIIDTMIAGSLINENRFSYTLDSMGKEYVGFGKNETNLKDAARDWNIDPKKDMWRLPAMEVGTYAEKDAELTLKLWQRLQQELTSQDLWTVFTLETDLFPCLIDMKFKGVRVNMQRASDIKEELIKKEKLALQDIKKQVGFDVEIWAAASCAKAFDKVKLPYDKTDKGNPSFTKNFLATHPHPLAKSITQARELNKAHTTFIDTIIRYEHRGRIHADINQIRSDQGGTVTGRFSYSNPNLQQVPARNKDLGPMIRSIFIPEEKCDWGCFDYSQQEPRILVHYASLDNFRSVDTIIESYKNADADFHQAVADMANIERKQAKTINLGLMYGMGKNKLMAELGLQIEAAERLIKKYHENAPFVKQLMDSVSRRAQDSGRIRTIGGRVCHFDLWEPTTFGVHKSLPHAQALREYGPGIKRAFTYKALNKLIQGSAADMTKTSMLALYKEGIVPHIQIHDELDISVQNPKQASKIIEIMEAAVDLQVPNKVDYEKGKNWGQIK
jgi:DNA polymerase I-like protein with 3'-5' exonuclease and polymerase domains